MFPVAIIWPAGTWRWWEAWVLIGIWMVFFLVMTLYLLRNDPALLAERMRSSPVQRGQKHWDKVLMSSMYVIAIGYYLIPGFDVIRFGWTEPFPQWIEFVAMAVHVPCLAFIGWVMHANTYLSRVVKIAEERDHRVITDGPYAIVRHPMYSAVIVLVIAFPVALGSRVGLIPAFLIVLLLIARTVFEDRTLRSELPGYPDYASVTRYRLVPGIW